MSVTNNKNVNVFLVLILLSFLSIFFGYVVIKYVLEPLLNKTKGGIQEWLRSFSFP